MKEEFSEEYIPQSNWMSFDEVGDYIKGTLVDTFYKQGQGTMPAQWVYVLKNVEAKNKKLGLDGKAVENIQESFNAGIKDTNDYINSRVKKAQYGQRIGFKFTKEIPAKTKGYSPAKSITPYVWDMDDKYDELKINQESMDDNQEINADDVPFN